MQGELPNDFTEWPHIELELRLGELALERSHYVLPGGGHLVAWHPDLYRIGREINHVVFELACRTIDELEE